MKLRLPADLKERIDKAAAQHKRSLNSEVVARLQESFPGPSSDIQETINTVHDVAMNIMRSLSPEEFRFFLYRVKRGNWERMGMDPEKMPPPPPTPNLDAAKDNTPRRMHEVAMIPSEEINYALSTRAQKSGRSIEDELAVVIQESLKKIGLLPPDKKNG